MDIRVSFGQALYKIKGRVAVAVSGGRDSMALLNLFIELNKPDITLSVVNVEHGIRGEESKLDSRFVKEYCEERGIPVFYKEVDSLLYAKNRSLSVEQAARDLRIAYFKSLLGVEVDYIALAHHKDDQCETIMMRVLRGTGVDGLSGMKETGGFIRPLLNVERNEINAYVEKNGIPYREDPTNAQSEYSRNFLRNEIFPSLESRWNYRRSLTSLAKNAAEISDLLDSLSIKPVRLEDGAIALDIESLKGLHPALIKHSIRKAAANFNAGVDFEEVNLVDVLGLIDKRNGASIDIAGGVRVWKEYGNLVFDFKREDETTVLPYKVGEFDFGGAKWVIKPREDETLRFSPEAIPENAVIRTMREGDLFCKFGGYTLPLGDFYTNRKVPLRLRRLLPVIAVGNEILVTPFEISEKVKVTCGGHTLARIKG